MSYEMLLDDLLTNLSKKGIDISKLKITEEQHPELQESITNNCNNIRIQTQTNKELIK